jgi:hypothetical protein
MEKNQRYLLRDFCIYSFAAFKGSIKSGNAKIFFTDLRYFPKWWHFRKLQGGTFDHKIPWLAFGAIQFLDIYLNKSMRVFEYGSGGSTIYFANKVHTIISAEHDEKWFNIVKAHIDKSEINNIDYRCSPPISDQSFASKIYNNPDDFISVLGEYEGMSFEKYVTNIDTFKEAYFDLIIVDGRSRISCISHAIPKVKKHGLLLVDNTNREYYLQPFPELADKTKWKKFFFKGHYPFFSASVLDSTSIFQRL